MPVWGIALIVIALIIVVIAISLFAWWISTMNWFNRVVETVHDSLSGIDVALTKRYDLLTKELAVVKGYAKHEYDTLTKVIENRRPEKNMSLAEKSQSANAMTSALEKLSVVVEQYPNLKADTQFSALGRQISEVEEELQAARRIYNSNVRIFNQKLVSWPASIVGKHYGHVKFEFFQAEEAKKQDVKIEF